MYKIIKSNIKHAIDKTNFSTIYLEKTKYIRYCLVQFIYETK